MKGKIWGGIAILLIAIVFSEIKFNKISALNRDILQYFNSAYPTSPLITTLDMGIRSDSVNYPHDLSSFTKTLDQLQKMHPKAIILAVEPRDLTSDTAERERIYQFFLKNNNLYINGIESSNKQHTFRIDPIFKNYPRFIDFVIPTDKISGAQDDKNRRAILSFDQTGPAELIENLRSLGLEPKPLNYFKYKYKYLETEQVFIKSYPPNKFGNFNTDELFSQKIPATSINDKIIVVGSNNEFSFLTLSSVFNLFNRNNLDIKAFAEPYQHTVANLIHLHIQGDYIKYINKPYVIYIMVFLYILLIFSKINVSKKLLCFVMLLPTTLVAQLLIYLTTDIYVELSGLIAFSLFFHYLILPAFIFQIFRRSEQKKMIELAEARLDAQVAISERVAHDIRSPLSAIKLLLSKAQFDNSEIKNIIYSSLDMIDATVEKILPQNSPNVSSIQEKTCSIYSLISSVIQENQTLHNWISYDLDCNPDLFNTIALIDPLEMHRVLNNIFDNSIHALSNHSYPKIQTKIIQKQEWIYIVIIDNGRGIPAHILSRIGKERVSTKTNSSGIGIGLLHSKKAIELAGGIFEISSNARGTTVSIKLKIHT